MRTLLLGTDFMYNSNGDLVPIEINTNVGIDNMMPEDKETIFDLNGLKSFILSQKFSKVSYIGNMFFLGEKINELCNELNLEYNYVITGRSLTIPNIEDTVDHLIIRSSYDISAIVDEEYCKNKVNFLNLIKEQSFGIQFAYLDENNTLVNNITTIRDNGNNPNFILKAVFPKYDRKIYPRLFKVTNQDELNEILKNLTTEYHLVEFNYNPAKLYQGHVQVLRSLNMIFPPNLNSIVIGNYTRVTGRNCDDISVFDQDTFEINSLDRSKYITTDGGIRKPKLLDSDLVEMSDGSFKSAENLLIGDLLKTIDIPNPNNIEEHNLTSNYEIDYETFVSGTTCTTNKVIDKFRVDKLVDYATITFTDGTTWEDTISSSYLIIRNDIVMFRYLDINDSINGINLGDDIILIYSCDNEMVSILKKIESVVTTKQFFGGWEITVENAHLFLTRAEDSESSYVAIEHNYNCYDSASCQCAEDTCGAGFKCCPANLSCGGPDYGGSCIPSGNKCSNCNG